MSSTSNINSVWKRRFIRVVAVFFLLYVGVDVATPQFCNEETERLALVSSAPANNEGIVAPERDTNINSEDSRQDPASDQTHQEDCLGCCAHVLPGTITAHATVVDLKMPAAALESLSLPTPPVRGTFHPPRFS